MTATPKLNEAAEGGSSPVPCSPSSPMEEQLEHDLKLAGEVIDELELKYRKVHSKMMAMKGRILAVSDRFAESQISHGKFRDGASDEATKMAHAGSADAYAHAKRMVREILSENDKILP